MGTFEEASGKTIDQAFREFDEANPHVWDRFKQLALQLITSGKDRYSAKTIICVIRFEHDLKTVSSDQFKINDIHHSRYARKFASEYPEYEGFFELRQLRSKIGAVQHVAAV
jgi:hypothetical protein